jgi:hypothetical protein
VPLGCAADARSAAGEGQPQHGPYRNRAQGALLPKCNRHRPLTVAMIVRLREELGIPADILIGPHRRAA